MTSSDNRKRTRSEVSGGEQDSVVVTRVHHQRRRTTETVTPTLPQLTEVTRYFTPMEYVIMKEAHAMVSKLVSNNGPYKQKLLELASESMNHLRDFTLGEEVQVPNNAEEVVRFAWDAITFYWAKQANRSMKEGKATAFASMGRDENQKHFPLIAISDCFRKNDCLSTGEVNNSTPILETARGKKTLLLFFRKIKHEFLHLVHRYLRIVHLQKWTEYLTPEKYTPYNATTTVGTTRFSEVGEHDEEEDSGGPILPRYHNKMLSDDENNPLCVCYNGQFLELTDDQVEGLLQMPIYFKTVQREGTRHDDGSWSWLFCRAVTNNILPEDFFVPKSNRILVRRSSSTASETTSRLSSPSAGMTPEDNRGYPLWRTLGHVPFERPVLPPATRNRIVVVSQPSSSLLPTSS